VRNATKDVYHGFRNLGLAISYDFRNVRAMQTVKQFIDTLGGTVKVADALQLPVSTVSGWNVNNSVPKWRRDALAGLARQSGVTMPDDFATQERAA
jgi:hypothetical protein